MAEPAQTEPAARMTGWLHAWRQGDQQALEQLTEAVYQELRQLAARRLSQESAHHTLHPTDLVHEVFVRLSDVRIPWEDRVHFFAVAATTMRRVLIDHARAKARAKRGGGALRVTLTDRPDLSVESSLDLLDLDGALTALADLDQQQARLVELYYFTGLTLEEIGATQGISTASAHRHLRSARAWMHRRLSSGVGQPLADG